MALTVAGVNCQKCNLLFREIEPVHFELCKAKVSYYVKLRITIKLVIVNLGCDFALFFEKNVVQCKERKAFSMMMIVIIIATNVMLGILFT